jgi:hypothetical protein
MAGRGSMTMHSDSPNLIRVFDSEMPLPASHLHFCLGTRCRRYPGEPGAKRSCYYEPGCVLGRIDEYAGAFRAALSSMVRRARR